MNSLTKEQKFVIFWLYTSVVKRMPESPCGSDDIIVDGINITEKVRELVQDRLFV